MYFKEIESDTAAKVAHDNNMKKNAADRLKANAEYNRRFKKSKKG